jgi:UDP-N-acetylglucosamine 2-epimerase (non-hydrolysing)
VTIVAGTRPELIKVAVLTRMLRADPGFITRLVFTGQHRSLMDQMAAFFGLSADRDLEVMSENQTPTELTSRLLEGVADDLKRHRPDIVLAQGDTCSVLGAALAAFYAGIPFGHIEAGLRSGSLAAPFPEEGIRRMVSTLTTLHFAPTARAAANAIRSGARKGSVVITGNTGIDTLLSTLRGPLPPSAPRRASRRILLTVHRRENQGPRMRSILSAVRAIVDARPDVEVVFPVHPNPNVLSVAMDCLDGHPRVQLLSPLDYGAFVGLMRSADLIMTDSGGIQEEAPSLDVPLLVLRESTERPEGVAAGVARLVGHDPETIVRSALELLDDESVRARMCSTRNPYGDGQACGRIVSSLRNHTYQSETPETPSSDRGAADPPIARRGVVAPGLQGMCA